MSPATLKRSYKIQALASDLGIRTSGDPIRDILRFCERRIQRFLRDFPECQTLVQLLDSLHPNWGRNLKRSNPMVNWKKYEGATCAKGRRRSQVFMTSSHRMSWESRLSASAENLGNCPMSPSSTAAETKLFALTTPSGMNWVIC